MSQKNVRDSIQQDKASQTTSNYDSIPIELLEKITNHQNDVLVISDLVGNVLFISDSIKRLLGYDKELYFDKGWRSIVTKETEKIFLSKVKENYNGNSFPIMQQHANGKTIRLRCLVDVLLLEENNEEFYLLTIQDITSQKETEELMIRAEKMSITGQLAAGIAHEIRNPLTAIKGFLQLLQSGIGDKDAYYKVMVDEIDKIDKITSELLFLAKPISENFNNFTLLSLVSDIVTLFQPQATQKEIEIVTEVNKDIQVHCDRTQIKQMFINLLKNAIEEMEIGGTIYITSAIRGDFVQVDVIDEGPGINPEIIHKINEPFFTTKEEGTGLGLVIIKQILDRHNGTLHVFLNEHIGSTFRVLLPYVK